LKEKNNQNENEKIKFSHLEFFMTKTILKDEKSTEEKIVAR
jgi:hypothetical protein